MAKTPASWTFGPRSGHGELVCIECDAVSLDGRGWRAEIVTDDEGVDEDEIAFYCTACWHREFALPDAGT